MGNNITKEIEKSLQDLYLSKKYILICEYYNPYPISINYRGHKNKLFKNTFVQVKLNRIKLYKEYAK